MLKIANITKRYSNNIHALKGVSFEVTPGVLGLVGPNGAGKSTLLRILATVSEPSSGSVFWKQVNVTQDPRLLRRELGYLPQDFSAYTHLTGQEFLRYIGSIKGLRGKKLQECIDWSLTVVNLTDAARRPLGGYSGGMRQRIGIAQALLNDPKLLILDEPTVGLDPGERSRFRHLLVSLSTDRVIILSTHIITDIEAAATNVAFLFNGELTAVHSPTYLLKQVNGIVWDVVIDDDKHMPAGIVVSTARRTDGVHVRLLTDDPPNHSRPVSASLEDAYSWALHRFSQNGSER